MLAGIILPFLATVAGKVIGDVVWPATPPRRPAAPEAAPAGGPTFAQTLAARVAPANARPAPAGPAVALEGGRPALGPMASRLPWVPGTLTPEPGDPASRVEAV